MPNLPPRYRTPCSGKSFFRSASVLKESRDKRKYFEVVLFQILSQYSGFLIQTESGNESVFIPADTNPG